MKNILLTELKTMKMGFKMKKSWSKVTSNCKNLPTFLRDDSGMKKIVRFNIINDFHY